MSDSLESIKGGAPKRLKTEDKKDQYICLLVTQMVDDKIIVNCWILPPEPNMDLSGLDLEMVEMVQELYSAKFYSAWSLPMHDAQFEPTWKDWNGLKTNIFHEEEFATEDAKNTLDYFLFHYCKGKLLQKPPESHELNFRILNLFNLEP